MIRARIGMVLLLGACGGGEVQIAPAPDPTRPHEVVSAPSGGAAVPSAATSMAEPRPAGPPPANLQVLAATTSRDEVLTIMNHYTVSLGVGCVHCHELTNMASDAKSAKVLARDMMRMTDDLNGQFFGGAARKLSCFTCHAGSRSPGSGPSHSASHPAPP